MFSNSDPKIVAVIPARGGSKRLPRKNVLPLANKPLIHYSIEAALHCPLVNDVIVSSEDGEICQMAGKLGATVINRPNALAEDHVKNEHVVKHAIDHFSQHFYFPDYIVLLQPTSPLRKAIHIEECLKNLLSDLNVKSSMSVCLVEHHPAKYILINDGVIKPYTSAKDMEERSQLLPPVYRQNGAIYAVKTEAFLQELKFYLDPCLPYIMPVEESIDIDTSIDLSRADFFLTSKGH